MLIKFKTFEAINTNNIDYIEPNKGTEKIGIKFGLNSGKEIIWPLTYPEIEMFYKFLVNAGICIQVQ